MPTRNVNLTEHFDQFIETGITSGRFGNASEVVREGLRLLEQSEREDKARIEWLRSAAREGFDAFDSGELYRSLETDQLRLRNLNLLMDCSSRKMHGSLKL